MKISYSPYTLTPGNPLNAVSSGKDREGILLQIDWGNGRIGYADLHPWTELGDASLEEQLSGLRDGKISPQIEQSIWLASRDADLRSQKKSIFDNVIKLKNNALISDPLNLPEGSLEQFRTNGFNCLKVKMGRDLKAEAEFVAKAAAKDFVLRLDFNGVGTWQTFERFIAGLERPVLARVEYVEDPFPFDENAWSDARRLVTLAIDNQLHKVKWGNFKRSPFDIMIIKPARTDVDRAVELCQTHRLQATVTSYMDHPVGMIHALGVAMELKRKYGSMMLDPGCMTHRLYQRDAFSDEIISQGPSILKVEGTGIGFDRILESQKWFQIKSR